jgi:hypothetical protein
MMGRFVVRVFLSSLSVTLFIVSELVRVRMPRQICPFDCRRVHNSLGLEKNSLVEFVFFESA